MTRIDELARTERLLVALDFDGTLAPLADEPMTVRMTAAARSAVADLAAAPATTVAFVSGRTLHDLRVIAEHGDDATILLAGSHGAEYWMPGEGVVADAEDPADLALRDRLRAEAESAASGTEGAWIEPKRFGFALHTRLVADGSSELQERVDALVAAAAPRWRRRTGHDLVEYSFREEGKDSAVAHLRALIGATAVVFAGDDVTDEDALRSLGPEDLGIRVGPGDTSATLRVADIDELADLLRRLAAARSGSPE